MDAAKALLATVPIIQDPEPKTNKKPRVTKKENVPIAEEAKAEETNTENTTPKGATHDNTTPKAPRKPRVTKKDAAAAAAAAPVTEETKTDETNAVVEAPKPKATRKPRVTKKDAAAAAAAPVTEETKTDETNAVVEEVVQEVHPAPAAAAAVEEVVQEVHQAPAAVEEVVQEVHQAPAADAAVEEVAQEANIMVSSVSANDDAVAMISCDIKNFLEGKEHTKDITRVLTLVKHMFEKNIITTDTHNNMGDYLTSQEGQAFVSNMMIDEEEEEELLTTEYNLNGVLYLKDADDNLYERLPPHQFVKNLKD